ncbi:D-sedoheptulose-7-phosphate isomerase [Luteipulveratus mongoliensis]|uniref:D-sedoheptulose-7-phosphate isomerase n=1 Tax=Luteipulveratus mongoliensis TaxID=571913 RepID=UPI001FE0A696|nr:SIS domain-containing protein [Luteipulveratus mongoliensis]
MNIDHPLRRVGPDQLADAVAARRDAGIASWVALGRDLADPILCAEVDQAGADLVSSLVSGGTLLVVGNGGSAAIASHVAAEFIGKCIHDRDPLPAISLAESLSSITAVGNDYGYEHVFTRGLAALGRPGDVLLAMTTSGTSPNVVAALDLAREREIRTIAMTGSRGTMLRGRADHVLVVPSDETPRIQEVHMLWAHAWCEAIDVLSSLDAHVAHR